MIKSEMERHFASWGHGREIDVQRLDPLAGGARRVPPLPGPAHLLLRRERRGRALGVGAGALPRGAVRRGPAARPRADRGRLREGLPPGRARAPLARLPAGRLLPPLLRRVPLAARGARLPPAVGARDRRSRDVRGLVGADKRWLQEQGRAAAATLVGPLLVSGRHHAGRMAGSIIGTRADRLPAPLRRLLSLEGRDTFTPYEVPGGAARARRGTLRPGAGRGTSCAAATRAGPIALEPHAGRRRRPADDRLGGAAVERRLRRAHDDLPAGAADGAARAQLLDPPVRHRGRREARRAASCATRSASTSWTIDAPVFRDLDALQRRRRGDRDRVAHRLPGARPARLPREGLPRPGRRAAVLRHLVAVDLGGGELPDGLPLHRVHALDGGHPARPVGARGRATSSAAPTSDVYEFAGERGPASRASSRVYARRETERRAVELALAGLGTAFRAAAEPPRRRVRLEPGRDAPFPLEDRGVQPPRALARALPARRAWASSSRSRPTRSWRTR